MSASLDTAPSATSEIRDRAERGELAYEGLVERPLVLRPGRRDFYVVDRRTSARASRLRFWSIALAAAAALLLFLSIRAGASERGWALYAGLTATGGSVLLARLGRDSAADHVPLLWISPAQGVLRVRHYPGQVSLSESEPVEFELVHEVLFASRLLPVPHASEAARVEGAGVFLRFVDGSVWPVIPGTFARDQAFAIASQVARVVGVGVKQVGRGWEDAA